MDADTRNFSNLKAGGALVMSFLGSGQGDLAFAFRNAEAKDGSFVSKDKSYAYESGAPIPTDAPGWADLKLVDTVETGDHAVVVVEVTDVGLREEAPDVLTLKELSLNYGG